MWGIYKVLNLTSIGSGGMSLGMLRQYAGVYSRRWSEAVEVIWQMPSEHGPGTSEATARYRDRANGPECAIGNAGEVNLNNEFCWSFDRIWCPIFTGVLRRLLLLRGHICNGSPYCLMMNGICTFVICHLGRAPELSHCNSFPHGIRGWRRELEN